MSALSGKHTSQRYRLSVGGVTGVFVRDNGKWILQNGAELAVLGGLGGHSEGVARLLAMVAPLEVGVAGIGDLKDLSECMEKIAEATSPRHPVAVPEDLKAAMVVACASWGHDNALEWLCWTLAERLVDNLFANRVLKAGWVSWVSTNEDPLVETRHRGSGWMERLDSRFWDHLANHDNPLVRAANAASDPNTTPSQLKSLAASDQPEVLDLVASHSKTTGKVLLDLASSQGDRNLYLVWRVAQNLYTPSRVLQRIASSTIAGLRDCNRYTVNWYLKILDQLAQNPNTPPRTLIRLSRFGSLSRSLRVAHNPNAPFEALERLTGHQEWSVREATAGNPTIPESLLKKLASDSRREVRAAAAGHPGASHGLLAEMAPDRSYLVREAVAAAKTLPHKLLESLAADPDGRVRRAVAHRDDTPPEILAKFATDPDGRARRAVAHRDDTPPEILAKFATDPDPDVRSAVAWNKSTPKDIVALLAEDSDYRVQRCVARNPKAPPDALLRLAQHGNTNRRRDVASNPASPPEAFRQLADDPSWGVQYDMAHNPCTPESVLEKLSQHEDRRIRASVAKNPNAPIWLVEHLSEDGCYAVFSVASEALAQRRNQGG